MAKPIEQDKFDKLPRWAQEHIRDLMRERQTAVKQLNEFVDGQKESRIWVDESPCTGEECGPSQKRHYIQAKGVTFLVGKNEVDVRLDYRDESHLKINCHGREMFFKPDASNQITIVDQE